VCELDVHQVFDSLFYNLQIAKLFLVLLLVVHLASAYKLYPAVTVKAQLHVKDPKDSKTHFMQVSTIDGKPVGIIVPLKKVIKKSRKPREVIEIEGIREADNASDLRHTYRNARIVNNMLMPYAFGYLPAKMESQEARESPK